MTAGIGVSMAVGYGTLYYPFAILAPEIARDLGWPLSFVFGCFSAALLSSAVTASIAGRAIDRFGARPVMMLGSVAAAASLAGLSLVTEMAGFFLAMLAIEVAARMVQYEAGFAALTAIHGGNARRHITHVTLIAGFSSTVFWPLVHALLTIMSWRDVCLVLAALNLVITLPIHAAVPNRPSPAPAAIDDAGQPEQTVALAKGRAAKRLAFVLMAVNFSLGRFLMGAVHSSFFILVAGTGRDAGLAALAGALVGPMQVVARIIEAMTGGRSSASLIGVISSGAMCGGIVLLLIALAGGGNTPVLLFAAVFGIGQGLVFIVRAVLPARLLGTTGYGSMTGKLAAISFVFTAAAPFVTAYLIENAGIRPTLVALTLTGAVALATSVMLNRLENANDRATAKMAVP